MDTTVGTQPLPQPNHASLGVLQELHETLRQAAADELAGPAADFIGPERRAEFRDWLGIHVKALKAPESLSPDLKRFLLADPARSRAIMEWMRDACEQRSDDPDWCRKNARASLAEAFQAEEQSGENEHLTHIVFGRRQLLAWLMEACLADSVELALPENRPLLKALVGASLGLVFIRYSQANRESYYHWLLCDLLPKSTWGVITDRLSVPEGAGTIGWIMQDALTAQTSPNRRRRPVAPGCTTLYSTFLDPKGRVAFEDELIGNRSISAIPILDNQEPVGVVFTFFPIDGLFHHAQPASASAGQTGRRRRKTFFGVFEDAVGDVRQQLLLALQVEGATKLYEVCSRRSSVGSLPGGSGESSASRERQAWLQSALVPDSRGYADPLGFQLAIEVLQRRKEAGSDTKILDNAVYLREETFANQLFSTIQLACQRPFRWAPLFSLSLRALHEVYHQFERNGTPIHSHAELTPIPTWHCRTGESGVSSLDELYPPETLDGLHLDHLRRSLQEPLRRLRARKEDGTADAIVRDLDVGLCLHSPPNRVVDLVIPLIASRTLHSQGHRWCAGFLRIKCVVESELQEGVPPNEEEVDRLHALYRFVGNHGQQIRQIARLAESFEDVLRAATSQRMGFEQLKTILDLRYVFCRAITAELTQAFSGSSRGNSFGLAAQLVQQLEQKESRQESRGWRVFSALAPNVLGCGEALASLCGDLRQIVAEGKRAGQSMPDVTLVSIWLTRNKPVITSHSGTLCSELDRQLFYVDKGVGNLLDLVLRVGRLNPDAPVDLSLGQLHAEHAVWPDAASLMVVPQVFYRPALSSPRIARFERILCETQPDGLRSTSTLFDGDKHLTIEWEWDRYPEPVSFALVPGRMTSNLLRSVQRIESLNLRPEVLALKNEGQAILPLSGVFMDSSAADPTSAAGREAAIDHCEHLNRLAAFMAGEGDSEDEPRWRVAGLSAGHREGVILAFGHSDCRRPDANLTRLRHAALDGVQAEYARRLRDAENVARDNLRELQSWTRHLLGNAFETLSTCIDAVEREYGDDPQGKPLIKALRDQSMNLQCLVESATEKKRKTLLSKLCDFSKLCHHLWQWYPCAITSKSIAGDCVLPDAATDDSFVYDLRCIRVLYMVLANLLDNAAIQAFSANGKVSLRCESRPAGTWFPEYSRMFVVEIENTGTTIPRSFAEFLTGAKDVIPTKGAQYRRGLLTVRRLLENSHLPLPTVRAPLQHGQPGTRVTLCIPRGNFHTEEADDE